MRVLADQDVWALTVSALRRAGHDVVTAQELGMHRAADEALLEQAHALDRLLLTRDKDFGALAFVRGARAAGILLLRVTPETVEDVHTQLIRVLHERAAADLQRVFCVVEPTRYRIRHLP